LKDRILNLVVLDALELARRAGDVISLNIVMLGAAAAIPGFPVEKELLLASMRQALPASTIEANSAAFESGYETVLAQMPRE